MRAKKEKHQCDFWYDKLQLNRKGKISRDPAKKGVGWAKILWDENHLAPTKPFVTSDGATHYNIYGNVMFERAEPYDIYIDPVASDFGDMRHMTHAPVRTIGEIQSNKLYTNTDKLAADHKLSVDNMRQFELRQELSSGPDLWDNRGVMIF